MRVSARTFFLLSPRRARSFSFKSVWFIVTSRIPKEWPQSGKRSASTADPDHDGGGMCALGGPLAEDASFSTIRRCLFDDPRTIRGALGGSGDGMPVVFQGAVPKPAWTISRAATIGCASRCRCPKRPLYDDAQY